MATNKRKEAAALFELIDKSTLKVPKHAGAPKIPDWWSSKSNPAPPLSSTADPVSSSIIPETDAELPELPPPVQPRLFDPPPAGASPSVSPSIRPPAIPPAHSPSPAPSRAPVTPPASPPKVAVVEPNAASAAPDRPVPRRTFAPQTMDQGNGARNQWMGHQKRRMARTSPWAILTVVLGALIVIGLIVVLVMSLRRHSAGSPVAKTTFTTTDQPAAASGNDAATLLPPRKSASQAPQPGNVLPQPIAENPPSSDQGAPTEAASVHGPGTVQRSPELYYVVISSTPTPSVAQKNAEFLARHGVDVSIEVVTVGAAKTRWYKLISVRGFPSMVAADPFRKEIVQIGHLHPDFKKTKKVWDDAFITRLTPIAPK